MTTPTLIQSLMIADEIRGQFPDLARRVNGRLEAAVNIAAAGMVTGSELDGIQVQSESNPAGKYLVSLSKHSCTCPDHGRHGESGIVCKHRLAAYIQDVIDQREDAARKPAAAGPFYIDQEIQLTRRSSCPKSIVPDRFTAKIVNVFYSPDGSVRTIQIYSKTAAFKAGTRFYNLAVIPPAELLNSPYFAVAAL
jgi:hypothetical protein